MTDQRNSSAVPADEQSRPWSVLVVEDEQIVARDLQVRLQSLGYDVPLTVATGELAVRETRKLRPDIVVMDIGLGGSLDGIEAARILRTECDVPVIFATAYSDDATLHRAHAAEPFGYVLKPYEARELRTVIETAIYKHRLERQLRSSEERYRQLFHGSPLGIIHFGTDLRVLEINGCGAAILGAEAPTLTGQPVLAILDPSVHSLVQKTLEGEPGTYQGNYQPVSGVSPFWVAMRAAPTRDAQGAVNGGMLIAENSNERRVVEEALIRRVNLEDLIAGISARLVNSPSGLLEETVRQILGEVGPFAGAERCFVLTFALPLTQIDKVITWESEDAIPRDRRTEGLSEAFGPWTLEKLCNAEPVLLHDVGSFPGDADQERRFWTAEGVRSLLLIPLVAEGTLVGTVGFATERSERIWAGEDLRLMRLLGEILAGVAVRDRVTAQLHLSEERYRRITTEITDYMYTVRMKHGHWTETSHGPGCAAVTGYTQDEYIADPHLWLKMVDERDRAAVMEQVRRVLAGEPSPPLEHRIQRKDGTQRWVKNTPVLHFEPDGRLASYDGLIQDITERRDAEEALRRSEERYRILVENLNDIVFAVDSRGYYTYISRRIYEIAGYSPEEVVNEQFTRFVHPHDRPGVLARLGHSMTGQIGGFEFRIMTKQASEVHVKTSTRPRLEHGEITGLIGIMTDCSEPRRAQESLREFERRFREVLELIPLAAALLDRNGGILFCNAQMEILTGRKRESLLGRRWHDECAKAPDRDRVRALFPKDAPDSSTGSTSPSVVQHMDVRGTIEWTITTLLTEEGALAGAACIGDTRGEGGAL